jgi:hypothetical protein
MRTVSEWGVDAIPIRPDGATHQGQTVGAGGLGFDAPGGRARQVGPAVAPLVTIKQMRENRASNSGVGDRLVGPLTRGFHAEVATGFCQGDLQRLASAEPLDH